MTWSITMADMRQEGFEEGLEQGREQGAYQNKLETAKAFLSEGLAPQMVARCTKLPLETVQQLAGKPVNGRYFRLLEYQA